MKQPLKARLGAVQAVVLTSVALAGIAYAAVASLPGARTASSAVVKKTTDEHALLAANYLDIVGVSPDAVAAVGLSAEQAGTIYTNLQAYLDGDGAGLQAVIDTWGAARTSADMAVRAVQSGKGDVETMGTLNSALVTALSNKQSAINAAFSAAVAQIDGSVADVLARIRANRSQNVPVQYLVTDRTEEQWRQLRDALSQKRTREAAGRELETATATLLADTNAEGPVSAAASNVANHLAGIQQAMR